MALNRRTNSAPLEHAGSGDRLTLESLVGIRLLAEKLSTRSTSGQGYLRILHQRSRVWREKAQTLPSARFTSHVRSYKIARDRHSISAL